jgi:hypothetical protein
MITNQQGYEASTTPQKQNLTLSVSNTTLYSGSRGTVTFTAPSNSRSIRATSSAANRRSLPTSSTVGVVVDEVMKLSWRADKRGEVVYLRVESATGIQSRPPAVQSAPRSASWRFGNPEKSKDRPKASQWPILGGSVRDSIWR